MSKKGNSSNKFKLAGTAKAVTRQFRTLASHERQAKGALRDACIEAMRTQKNRDVFAEAMLPLCRTQADRDGETDAGKDFQSIRMTVNQEPLMGEGNAWTISTKVDKDSDGNLTQAPAIVRSTGKGGSTVKRWTEKKAVESFEKAIHRFPIGQLAQLVELTPARLHAVISREYEERATKARNKAPNNKAGRAKAKKNTRKAA